MINVGAGHHGLLGLLEQEGFEVMILNKNGEWYPFAYAQDYKNFRDLQALAQKPVVSNAVSSSITTA